MPTRAQIAEQVAHEREAIRCGVDKLLKQTEKAEHREYASATVYGRASITEAQAHIAEEILKTFAKQVNEGRNGQSYAEIKQYLQQFNNPEDANILANIALKRTFDLVFSIKKKDSKKFPNTVANVCTSVGASVEQECQIRWYEQQDPELLAKLIKYFWRDTTGVHQKMYDVQHLFTEAGITWKPWSALLRARLGGWLVGVVTDVTGWFEKEFIRTSKTNNTPIIVATERYLAIQDQLMEQAILFAPLAWPMLTEPNNWTHEKPGGYYLNELMRGNPMVRNGDPTLRQPEPVLNFVNKLQAVPYTLNRFVYGVALDLKEKGRLVGKFKPIEHAIMWDFPPKPPDIDTNEEALKDWKRATKRAHNDKKKYERSMHVKTSITMDVAKRFIDKDKFFLPWSFDYRGRCYPIPPFLSIQDTDFGKSLLTFAKASFMTPEAEEWLAFQVATTYGLDKAPMAERLEWVKNNTHLISCVASDPILHIHEWETADEPWQFLAACDEYYHCVLKCDRHETRAMIATDATCSGLQILAGLARDRNTAQLVNVLPSDRPQDAYKVVAEQASPHCPKSIRPYMDRKTVKRVVMTVPYNAKPFSNRGYIRDALKEKGVEIDKDDLTQTVVAVRNAMDEVVPGPMAVMSWIESEVSKAIDRGKTELTWTTPSGFVVTQKLMKKKTVQVELQLMGRCKLTVAVDDSDKVDKQHHKNATAPNLIHSLDSSLLHFSALRFDAPIALIHDSVLCRATDMSHLSAIVRETYMHLFAEHDYLRDFADQIEAETEPPIIGDLQPESVIESTYFFC